MDPFFAFLAAWSLFWIWIVFLGGANRIEGTWLEAIIIAMPLSDYTNAAFFVRFVGVLNLGWVAVMLFQHVR